MDFILNIGLKVGATETVVTHVVRQCLASEDFVWKNEGKVFNSDTEPTLVIEVSPLHNTALWVLSSLKLIAKALGQDCIAVYRPKTGKGALIGPNAQAWGEFDPQFFILPDGTRLSEQIARKVA